jgi:hypothetical protein
MMLHISSVLTLSMAVVLPFRDSVWSLDKSIIAIAAVSLCCPVICVWFDLVHEIPTANAGVVGWLAIMITPRQDIQILINWQCPSDLA